MEKTNILNKINSLAAKQGYKPTLRIPDMIEEKLYTVQNVKLVVTRFGSKFVAELVNNDLFLPNTYNTSTITLDDFKDMLRKKTCIVKRANTSILEFIQQEEEEEEYAVDIQMPSGDYYTEPQFLNFQNSTNYVYGVKNKKNKNYINCFTYFDRYM